MALAAEDQPFPHLPLTSDHLDLGFHARAAFDGPLLLFECADLGASTARLRELSVPLTAQLPRGLDRKRGALIEAPDDIALLLIQAAA